MTSWDLHCQFFVAIQNNKVNDVEALLGQGVDPDMQFQMGSQKRPTIFLCVERGKTDLVKLLVRWGCSINQSDADGLTALHIAANHGNNKLVEILLDNRAHVNAVTLQGYTPLHLASQTSSLDVVRQLVEAGAQLDRPDNERKTALLNACIHGRADIARYLVRHGAEVEVLSQSGNTSLIFVAASPHVNVSLVSCLLEAGACVNRQNLCGESALHAVIRGHSDGRQKAMAALLGRNCDLNLRTNLGHTALHLTVLQQDDAATLCLVKAGCLVDPRDELGLPPLFYAVRYGNANTTLLLLAAGAGLGQQEWLTDKKRSAWLDPALQKWLLWKRRQCRKLTEICRITIRMHTTLPLEKNIAKLNLPPVLERYLALDTL